MEALEGLEKILAQLEAGAIAKTQDTTGPDALDAVLAEPPRTTAVRRLREDEVIQRFRTELATGLVRGDTVRGFFDLLTRALDALLAGRA
jgi:hypothetical protein